MLRRLLKRLLREPDPQILIVRTDPVVWTMDDAKYLRSVLSSQMWGKLVSFQHDAIFNSVLNQQRTPDFVKGWRYALAEIEAFKGVEKEDEKNFLSDTREMTSMVIED